MKRYLSLLMLIPLLIAACNGYAQSRNSTRRPFKVYGFIVYGGYIKNGERVNANYEDLQIYLAHLGIAKYDLIYENKMLDYPAGNKENGSVNYHKMDSLSARAAREPDIPVSLDLEGWKRFDTLKTPQRMLEAIGAFKKNNKASLVGLYATVPQNTYGYDDKISRYDKVNKAYSQVAAAVDYFSPSLYNYKTTDSLLWKKSAVYSIGACKKYNYPAKKILPYLTPEISINKTTSLLTYSEMMFRLQTLYDLGADGCLIWTSSGTRDNKGNKIYIDENEGWLKAVKDFIARHS